MKTTVSSMIRGFVACAFLMGPALMAERFATFTQELNVANGSFPQEMQIELPGPGNVHLEAVKFPKGATKQS